MNTVMNAPKTNGMATPTAPRQYPSGTINVTDREVRDRLKFIGLTEKDLGVIAAWKSVCEGVADVLIDQFYSHIFQNPKAKSIVARHTTVDRQRPVVSKYVLSMFSGRIDNEYIEYRRRVGVRHDDIDLDANWYVAMYEVIRRVLTKAVKDAGATPEELIHFTEALGRLILVDIALCIQALMDSRRTKLENMEAKQRTTLADLIKEITTLTIAARDGNLKQRADESHFEGDVKKLVANVNTMLNAILMPIQEATDVLERIAARDLTARVMGKYQGDHARIKNALNTAAETLDQGLAHVQVSSEQVNGAADQISSSSQSLAQSTSEQASSLEEISASLEEITDMTRRNADNAKQASKRSDEMRTSTEHGVNNMNRLSDAISRIKKSSDQTAKILKTINEIAFQTNLLALNAAVEAARAGDAGRGFAVVAEEVRNLAQRSAEASTNTAELIEESVKNAESGVDLNQEVLENLATINNQANQVGAMMEAISSDSVQQNEAVEQITAGVDQLNTATQRNAANSEEFASASEELSSQASEMRSMVQNFQLTQNARRAPIYR